MRLRSFRMLEGAAFRLAIPIASMGGMGVIALLLVRYDWVAIGHAVLTIGWSGLLCLALLYLLAMAVCGLAWAVLLPELTSRALVETILIRWIRGALSCLLPIGGELAALRLMVSRGTRAATAGASIIVDFTIELLSQIGFTAVGVVLLFIERPRDGLAYSLIAGLAPATLAILGLLLVQRRTLLQSFFGRITSAAARRLRFMSLAANSGLSAEIEPIYRNPRRWGTSLGLHQAAWVVGAAEAWTALYLLHAPLGFVEVLIIESIAFALRSAAFAVPGALGIQEGGYVMLGAIFGLSPEVALALALVKRAREVALTFLALLAWQFLERRVSSQAQARRAVPSAVPALPADPDMAA